MYMAQEVVEVVIDISIATVDYSLKNSILRGTGAEEWGRRN
jgi:hypothetical protein